MHAPQEDFLACTLPISMHIPELLQYMYLNEEQMITIAMDMHGM